MISKFFIDRPVLANVLAIVMVLIGGVALFTLPVAQYPNVVPPTVSVSTRYPGASADTVMNTVALPIEQQVNGVQGMIYMQSTSAADGTYALTVTFEIGTDLNFAQVLVQNRISAAMASLPQAVQVQGVTVQQKSTSILQIVALTAPDGRYDSLFLSNYATITLAPELSQLAGVGNVAVLGVGQYSMRIWLDPEKLFARGLGPDDVIRAIQQQSQQVTSGQVGAPPAPAGQNFQYTVNVEGRLADPAEFANIIVKVDSANGGQITRIRDVGRVELGAQTYSQSTRLNGKPAAGIAIYQLPIANALNVAALVNAKMAELAKAFPQGLAYRVPFDTTRFVNASIHEVYKTLVEAAVLVLIVILVFLQDWRATLVPATTVPVTIIGAFAAMAALGFTVNLSTLFAIILSIGIVVDDAIVVVEGAAHHIERGLSPHDAAIRAMDELFGPIVGITLVLMAVFVPAAFLPGLTGQIYAQFALVIAATALISAVNAATLKPTQCALWLRTPVPPERRNLFFRGFNRVYQPIENAYARLIGGMTRRSATMVVIALIVVGTGVWGIVRLPTSFIPIEDQGYVMVAVQLPDGAAVGRTQQVMDQVTQAALAVAGVDQVITISGISVLDNSATLANAGVAYVILKDWSLRGTGSGTDLRSLYGNLQRSMDRLQDAVALVLIPPPIQGIGNASGFTMQVELRDGSFDYTKLQTVTRAIVRDGNTQTGLQRLLSPFRAGVPQLQVAVDRVKAETLNVQVGDVFDVLAGYIGSSYVNQFNKFGRTVPGLRAGGLEVPPAADRHREALRAHAGRQDGAPRGAGADTSDGRTGAGRSLQSVPHRHHSGRRGAGLQFRRGDQPDGADRRPDPATRRGLRLDRDVLSGEDHGQPDLLRVRPRHAAGVSVPGRTVRELDRADLGDPRGAAVADGSGDRTERPRAVQQPLHSDRSCPADRIVGEERHPHCGDCTRAAHAAGRHCCAGGGRCGARSLPSDRDDLVRVHSRRRAAGNVDRRGGQCARLARACGAQRHACVHLAGGAVRTVVLRGDAACRGVAEG